MWVDPFFAGVFCTVVAELGLLILAAVALSFKKKK